MAGGALSRYDDNLKNSRAPGTGCHGWIMSTANLGVFAGLDGERIFEDIRRAIPQGNRRIPDREIQDAIKKALNDHNGGTFTPKPRPEPAVNDGKTALQRIIEQGRYHDEADLWEVSPIRLLGAP
jgi:hypothetical protein